ncbi:MAG: murein biosynthesis integral membrane protein MurJ [Rhizobiaceae bacterium]
MSLIKKFATVGGSTMASRILGFVREALIAATLGAGPVADAFYAAFGFPNMFRRILGEGAFNSAFIPLFAKEFEGGGKEAARKFAEQVLAVLVVVLLALSAVFILFMPFMVDTIFAPGFSAIPAKFDITVDMARIMFPYLFCMSLVAMLSGIMNSMRHYFLVAILPVLLNVVLVSLAAIALYFDYDDNLTGQLLAWGVVFSGFLQLGLLYWGVRKQDFQLSLKMPTLTPQVRRLMVLMGPAILTGGVVQINIMIGRIIASSQDGAISLLNYADRINQLPLGIIGVAVGVVLLPELSRALKSSDMEAVQNLQNNSLEFALALTLPAAVGFVIMPEPIVNILYQRGAFDAETTSLTAMALAAFAFGLPAYVLIKVFLPAFFAREDMKSPLWFSIISVALNIAISLMLFPSLGHVAIALATAISAWVNIGLLGGTLWVRGEFRPSPASLKRIGLMIVASVIMGIFLWGIQSFASDMLFAQSVFIRIVTVLVAIFAGAALYFIVLFATGALEKQLILKLLRRGK